MYNSSLKYKWDNKNVLDTALQEGFEKAIELGIEKGIEKGEHSKAVYVALEMKKEGFPFVQISKFTGLSIEEIEKL